jgi:hypothetical protein
MQCLEVTTYDNEKDDVESALGIRVFRISIELASLNKS